MIIVPRGSMYNMMKMLLCVIDRKSDCTLHTVASVLASLFLRFTFQCRVEWCITFVYETTCKDRLQILVEQICYSSYIELLTVWLTGW